MPTSPFDARRAHPERPEFQPRTDADPDLSDYSTQLMEVLTTRWLISPVARTRPMRCRTGYVRSDTATCASCGASREQPCAKK